MAGHEIEFSEETDILASLILFESMLERLPTETWAWKWAILSLHSAICTSAVWFLSGSTNTGHLYPKDAQQKLRYLNGEGEPPEKEFNVVRPKELFKRLRYPEKRIGNNKRVIEISDAQAHSFMRLNDEFRNYFTHFLPISWYIEVSGFPDIFIDNFDIVTQVLRSGGSYFHVQDQDRAELNRLLTEIPAKLSALRAKLS